MILQLPDSPEAHRVVPVSIYTSASSANITCEHRGTALCGAKPVASLRCQFLSPALPSAIDKLKVDNSKTDESNETSSGPTSNELALHREAAT